MNPGLDHGGLSAVLLDIEGTTTPFDFVHKTLFSFARQQMSQFLQVHWKEGPIQTDIAALKEQHGRDRVREVILPEWPSDSPDAEQSAALEYMNWLMDRDVKCTSLKSLQGRIWQDGYRRGELRAEVYPDVPQAFRRWSRQERPVLIFSSGSVLAQKLLFENTNCGDLSGFLLGYFDTTTGSKVQCESYRKISSLLSRPTASIIFVSDTPRELDAAFTAGMQTALCVRDSSRAVPASRHPAVCTLDKIFPEEA